MDERVTLLAEALREMRRQVARELEDHPRLPYCPQCDIPLLQVNPTTRGREVYVCDECASMWECISREGGHQTRVDNE